MGSYKLWDEDTYRAHKGAVNILYDHCRTRCFALQDIANRSFICNGRNHDAKNQVANCIRKFEEATARLNALQNALNSYWEEYTSMLQSSQGTMDEVDVSNALYGTFAGFAAAGAAANAAVYASSSAYQFHQAGFSFSNDFSDAEAFMSESYFDHFEVLEGLSNMSNWESLTLDLIFNNGGNSPTAYSEGLMEQALLNSLEMVPGYTVEVPNGDISAFLAELTGMPDLDKQIRKIIDWINEHAEDGTTDAFIDELSTMISDLLNSLGLDKHASGLIESLSSKAFLLEFYGMMAKISVNIVDIAEAWLDISLNAAANHLQQTAYLDSIEEALAMCGYTTGGLVNMIGDIRTKLSSEENYFWQTFLDQLDSVANDQASSLVSDFAGSIIMNACSHFPSIGEVAAGFNPIAGADAFLSGVSIGVNALAGDQIQAVETLRGIQMYSQPLIASYERYMKMMDAGIASAEDVKQAQSLFELIRASKMKEYECIQTIDMYGYWHDLAKEKYDQLADWGPAVWEQIGLTENPVLTGRRD